MGFFSTPFSFIFISTSGFMTTIGFVFLFSVFHFHPGIGVSDPGLFLPIITMEVQLFDGFLSVFGWFHLYLNIVLPDLDWLYFNFSVFHFYSGIEVGDPGWFHFYPNIGVPELDYVYFNLCCGLNFLRRRYISIEKAHQKNEFPLGNKSNSH